MRWTSVVSALTLLAAGAQAATTPGSASAAALKRNYASCSTQANLDACYDAMRWNPSDPVLLVATGDALMHAGRPADAIRNYHRAAQLAPNTHGIAAKISKAEARQAALTASLNRRYSNAAPETQSH
jgi:cytochrome c-type biogenesis protein CcmH/NrfG